MMRKWSRLPFFIKFFYMEATVNVSTIILSGLWPARFLSTFDTHPPSDLALMLSRWFAVMLAVITFAMFRALLSGRVELIRFMLQAYLVGDVLFLAALVPFINQLGGWLIGSVFTVIYTIVLASARITCLLRPSLLDPLQPAACFKDSC